MEIPQTAEAIRDVNRRYHDVAAASYDSKWGIRFDPLWQDQVITKVRKLLGDNPGPFERALEIGAGTGYFTLNLMQAGTVKSAVCTDIAPGMLEALAENAEMLGLDVETVSTDAERLPFEDESFDLVHGHAILHHIPDLSRAFAEFWRVLKPGGVLFFAGEPSQYGDRLAQVPKLAGSGVAPVWRKVVGAAGGGGHGSDESGADHSLEGVVDIHTFSPGQLEGFAREAGFGEIRVRGEELLASMFGWFNRSLETSAASGSVPLGWAKFACRSYLTLQKVDRALLEPRMPAQLFYNLMIAAEKP